MEVNRLLGDELTYELTCRALPIGGSVSEKRESLREVLRLERLGERIPPISAPMLEPGYELSTCEGKLSDLEENLREFNQENRKNEYKKIKSRLIHLTLRLDRINGDVNSLFNSQRDRLLTWCSQLQTALETLYISSNHTKETNQRETVEVSCEQDNPHVTHQSLLDVPVDSFPEYLERESPEKSLRLGEFFNFPQNQLDTPVLKVNSDLAKSRVSSLRQIFESEPSHVASRQQHYTLGQLNRRQVSFPQTSANELKNDHITSSSPHVNYQKTALSQQTDLVRNQDPQYPRSNYPNNYCHSDVRDNVTRMQDLQIPQENDINPIVNRERENWYSVDVSRWRLQFDGISSVTSFLERIEELRLSRGVSKERLLRSAPEVFTKDALLWYRMGNFVSWDDLVEKLRAAFQPHDYEYSLWEEIRRRTQGSHERIINYVAVMENLFKKLSVLPSERDRVQIMRRNMLPNIQTQLSLQPLTSISELIQLARTIEETELRIQKFVPPPSNLRHLVEPDLAYKKPSGSNVASVKIETKSQPSQSSDQYNGSQPTCWNCNQTGHRFKKCKEPRKIFCFRCGQSNVIASTCPKCSKNLERAQQ